MKPSVTLCVSAFAILAAASPALAQEVVVPAEAGQEAVEEDAGQLTDIVVTAQRRAERAQAIPVSISVVGGETIENAGIRGLQDISRVVPSLNYDPANGGGFNIRGIGTQVYELSAERAVGVVVDDVVQDLPRDFGISALTDVARVEVLRGPQGILFGKNSSSGVVSVITKRPDFTAFSGDAAAEYGKRNDRKFTANLNVPLGSTVAARVSGYYQGQDGFARYTVLGKSMGDFHDYGVRAKLLFAPSDRVDFLLIGDFNRHKDNGLGTGASLVGSGVPAVITFAEATGLTVGPRNADSASDVEGLAETESKGVSMAANLKLGDHTLTSVTAYREVKLTGNSPVEPDPVTRLLPFNRPHLAADKVSQELRLSSPSNGVVSYVVGLFYNRLHSTNAQEQAGTLLAPLPANTFLSLTNGFSYADIVNESKAAFASMTIRPSDRFELIVGGRVTRDEVDFGAAFSQATCQPAFGTCTSLDVPYTFIPIAAPLTASTGSTAKTNFSYRVAPTFKVSKDVLLFASYSTGYKGPGVTSTGGVIYPFKAETVQNFELGVKSELFDRRLRLNVTGFYTKFKDFQTQQLTTGAIGFLTANAGGLRSQGVEVEATVKPIRALTLNAGVTYADTVFTDYQFTPTVNYRGLALPNAPKWSFILGANLNTPITSGLVLDASTNFSYRSKVFMIAADPASVQEGYGILQARVGIGPEDGQWKIGVYGRNLTNQYYTTAYFDYASFGLPFQFRQTSPEAARTVGGFVSVKF